MCWWWSRRQEKEWNMKFFSKSSIYWFIHPVKWSKSINWTSQSSVLASQSLVLLSSFRSSTSISFFCSPFKGFSKLTWLLRHLSTFNLKCVFREKKKSYWDIMRSRFFFLLFLFSYSAFFCYKLYFFFSSLLLLFCTHKTQHG